MSRIVSAAEANRQFSEILSQAVRGETVVITRRGEPVAELVALGRRSGDAARDEAWRRLMATLEAGLSLGGDSFDRDALYER